MKMQPDRLEDLIAANALYRPGPMELIPDYCDRKHKREPVPAVHPIMDAILAETYGIMVYQEQVMQIFNQLGGIELANAYKLIKAISKKTVDVIAKFKPDFIKGTMDKGVSKEKAEEIFELILKFGGYGFNKSHSTRYAIVAFQTAYMKCYHPVEYMAALLTFEMGSTEKVVEYIEECRKLTLPSGGRGVRVLPPDVNASDKDFTPVYVETDKKPARGRAKAKPEREGVIRFGLCAVRGVGEKAVESVIAERKVKGDFTTLYDFCERVDLKNVQRSTIEALIRCGAFASVSPKRRPLLEVLDKAVEMGQQTQNDKRSGQLNMFAALAPQPAIGAAAAAPAPLPDVEEYASGDLLKFEKELLGFYVTSHPLTQWQDTIDRYATHSTREAMACGEGADVFIGAMLSAVRSKVAKSGRSAGQRWAILELEDLDGKIEGMCFAETFANVSERFPGLLAAEQIVMVRAKVDRKRETPCLVINDVMPVREAISKLTTNVGIKLDPLRHGEADLVRLREIIKAHPGRNELALVVHTADRKKVSMKVNGDLGVRISVDLVDALTHAFGQDAVLLAGDTHSRKRRLDAQRAAAARQPALYDVPPADTSTDPADESMEPALAEAD